MVTAIDLFGPTNTKALWTILKWNYWLLILSVLVYKWQICYTEMTYLLQFKINVRKFNRQLQCTLQLVWEDCVLLGWSFTFRYADSSNRNASEQFVSSVHLSFVNFALSSVPTNKILTDSALEIQTAPSRQLFRIRHVFIWASLTMTDIIAFKKCWLFLLKHPVCIIKSHSKFLLLTPIQTFYAGQRLFIQFI